MNRLCHYTYSNFLCVCLYSDLWNLFLKLCTSVFRHFQVFGGFYEGYNVNKDQIFQKDDCSLIVLLRPSINAYHNDS